MAALVRRAGMSLPERLQQAFGLFQSGQTEAAEKALRAIAAEAPETADAHHLLGIIAYRAGDLASATKRLERAIAADPRQAEFHNTLGAVRRAAGDADGAVDAFEAALGLRPRHAQAAANLGNALAHLKRLDAAAASYRRALEIAPNSPGIYNNLGNVLAEKGDIDGAIASFHAALALAPDYPEALSNLGLALARAERFEEAIAAYRKALAIDPDHLPALANIGGALLVVGYYQEAMRTYERTVAKLSDVAQFHFNMAALQNYLEDATTDRTLRLAQRYGESLPAAPEMRFDNVRDPEKRLRVGLVSADFHAHSVTRFLLPLLEARDATVVDYVAVSMDSLSDAVTERLRGIMGDWHDIRSLDADRAAAEVRAAGIDVLIDLSGYTSGARLDLFARRAAPVQCSWMGYSGTTGISAMDYIIADLRVAPPGSDGEFSEKVWRLPDSYLCFGRPDWPPPPDLPAARNGYVTFGSFNNIGKLSDSTLACWIDLLQAVPGSRLLIKSSRGGVSGRLAELADAFITAGIAADRLRFVDRLADRDAHIALYGEVDIGLDPFPYNGTTTTCEALWSGVPVLTRRGSSFVSRVGESLMHSARLDDWVADDAADYVRRAAGFAADLHALQSLRAALPGRVAASPLGDAPRFAGNFEAGLRGMWRKWCDTQV